MLESSDAQLVGQCLQGDNRGFDGLVKRYQRRIICFCYRMLGDADLASDAAQESFLKAYRALDNFRTDASFLSWMFKIAGNTCLDILRKQSRQRTDSLEDSPAEIGLLSDASHSPEKSAIFNENDRIIRQAILDLPENYRQPIVMFYFGDLSLKEVAETLERPEGTIKSCLHTAREMLRRKLEGVV